MDDILTLLGLREVKKADSSDDFKLNRSAFDLNGLKYNIQLHKRQKSIISIFSEV